MTTEPKGATADGQSGLNAKQRILTAALELFDEDGYEGTTVDAIVRRAGVSRRLFFHHFASKDAVVFQEHVALIGRVEAFLAGQEDTDPVPAVASALAIVLSSLTDDPGVARKRYRLIKDTPELRDTEIAWVHRYQLVFARYLSGRFRALERGPLMADMAAAALVAVHNNVLRSWLRSKSRKKPTTQFEDAVRWFQQTFVVRSQDEQDPRLMIAVFDADTDPSTLIRAVRKAARGR